MILSWDHFMVKIVFLRICTKEEILVFKISVHDLRTRTINMKAFVVFTRRLLLKLVQKTEITFTQIYRQYCTIP